MSTWQWMPGATRKKRRPYPGATVQRTSRYKTTRFLICFAGTIIVLLVAGTAVRPLTDPVFSLPSKMSSKDAKEEKPAILFITPEDEAEVTGIWANAPHFYLHVGLKKDQYLIAEWQSIVEQQGRWTLRGKVAEIGIGDGWLGAYLLQRDPELRYVGVDVSPVSREATEARLASVDEVAGRYAVVAPPVELGARSVDVVVSLKTIQHFPSGGYARRWFADVGASGARRAVLQFCGPCDGGDEKLRCEERKEDDPFDGARCFMTGEGVAAELGKGWSVAWVHFQRLSKKHDYCNIWAGFALA